MVAGLLQSTGPVGLPNKSFSEIHQRFPFAPRSRILQKKTQIFAYVIPTGNGFHGIFSLSIDVFFLITFSTVCK